MKNTILKSFQVPEVIIKYFPKINPGHRQICSSMDFAYGCFLRSWDTTEIYLVEEFKVLLLDQALGIIGICSVGKGGRTMTPVDVKMILVYALKSMATKIIVAHNHPSGTVRPSRADVSLTKKLLQACDIVDIQLIDHLIISPESYYSFSEDGQLEEMR